MGGEWIHVYVWLSPFAETIAVLLIGYIPIQNNNLFSFLFFIFYFTLQYCIGFAIYWHESTTGVHEFPILNPPPPLSPYHLSGSSQCISPKHPVSWIEPGLVTHFTHFIDTCFNAILPNHPTLSLSHRVQKSFLLYLCLFCCLTYRVIITIFPNSIYMC